MARLIVSQFISVDGVVEDPAGAEGFERGGWVGAVPTHPAIEGLKLEEGQHADGLLLGARTYEFFAARWPSRPGELAERLNSIPKYVLSTTASDTAWNNSIVLADLAEVTERLHSVDGAVLIYGSLSLTDVLLADDLIDEIWLTVLPVVIGKGRRLFGSTPDVRNYELTLSRELAEGVVHQRYSRNKVKAG